METKLTEMEKRMFPVLQSAAIPAQITEIEKGARAMGNGWGQMNAKNIQVVEDQAVFKGLRELFQLPCLSLFYMEASELARAIGERPPAK